MTIKVRKQFLLDPELLRQAREALQARTDTEAVERALEEATKNAVIDAAHRELIASGIQFKDVYGVLDQ